MESSFLPPGHHSSVRGVHDTSCSHRTSSAFELRSSYVEDGIQVSRLRVEHSLAADESGRAIELDPKQREAKRALAAMGST
jgi:hypothetical protein